MGAYFSPTALSEAEIGHRSLVWKIVRVRKKVGRLKVPGGGTKVRIGLKAAPRFTGKWPENAIFWPNFK